MRTCKTIFFLILLGSAVSAYGAAFFSCGSFEKVRWKKNEATVRVSSQSFLSAASINRVDDAIQIVNNTPAAFQINWVFSPFNVGDNNGFNEVYATDIDRPAEARWWMDCYYEPDWKYFVGLASKPYKSIVNLREVDIILDLTPNWTFSSQKSQVDRYGGPSQLAEGALVHEFGHFLGLAHLSTEYNVMGDEKDHMLTQNGTTRSYFGEDASKGAVELYGTKKGSYRDLLVSHFRYTGVNGEYSEHGRTRALRNNGTGWVETQLFSGDGNTVTEQIWEVNRGETIRFEFTIENTGKQDEKNVRAGVYISTNDWISTFDQLIYTHTWPTIGAQGLAATVDVDVTIPSNLQQGRVYWVGFYIDDNKTINEKSGKNNTAYVPVWIN